MVRHLDFPEDSERMLPVLLALARRDALFYRVREEAQIEGFVRSRKHAVVGVHAHDMHFLDAVLPKKRERSAGVPLKVDFVDLMMRGVPSGSRERTSGMVGSRGERPIMLLLPYRVLVRIEIRLYDEGILAFAQ